MIASPYGFLRGTAVVMAEDVAHLPATGITPVVCGDAHLGNFGFYASPERDLVIDLNDFDEAHPGGWEWDLRRLVASIWVAGRQNGASEEQCGASALSCVASYREELRRLADQPLFSRSFVRLDVDRLGRTDCGSAAGRVARSAKRARNRTSDRALPRFTREVDGVRKIVEEPPLITRLPGAGGGASWPRRSTNTCKPFPRIGVACSAATPWSTSRTRSSGWAVSGYALTWRCWRAPRPTTWFSCSSSRPAGQCWRATCTANRRGTHTRASG